MRLAIASHAESFAPLSKNVRHPAGTSACRRSPDEGARDFRISGVVASTIATPVGGGLTIATPVGGYASVVTSAVSVSAVEVAAPVRSGLL